MSSPELFFCEALCKEQLSAAQQVKQYRITEGAPASPSLRGSLKRGSGLLYQYVARIQALAQLLVEVWLTPTARYSNRVAITEVLTRAVEACHQMICTGSMENESESYSQSSSAWPFNTVLDNVVFTTVFGIVVDEPTEDAGMLQVQLAGTAPGIGEYHYAFPSDCFAWAARDRSFIIAPGVEGEDWSRACAKMVDEWQEAEQAFARGGSDVQARWMSGGPVRAAIGGVGGNRWLLMAPEPIPAELWKSVSGNLRNVKLTCLSDVDRVGDAQSSLAQRAKQPSAGGTMSVFSSKTGSRRHVIPWGEASQGNAQVEDLSQDGNAGER